ncbi:hypothetical protein [Sporosarcina sp. YIM B06819]|uniref:hypothetical protein n=1 Tax=Sporosarcina sp. YIM B06819 TaxID=3081769 RepID=UPI00298C8B8B|nr:hypothetical protein [Sporosarcina sp. YIM B06819]
MENVLLEIKNELKEMRQDMANMKNNMAIMKNDMATKEDISSMATKEDISMLATKADVADIPLIKQAILESRHELAAVRETTDGMKIDIQELKENDVLFEEILLHQRKLIDMLTIKTSDHEAQLKWVR